MPPHKAISYNGHDPSRIFPPGYPLALSVASGASGGIRSAARALDVVLIFVNLLLVGMLTARMTAYRSAFIAAIPPVLLLLVPDGRGIEFGWMTLHLSAMSEPRFTALATGAVLEACRRRAPPERTDHDECSGSDLPHHRARFVGASLAYDPDNRKEKPRVRQGAFRMGPNLVCARWLCVLRCPRAVSRHVECHGRGPRPEMPLRLISESSGKELYEAVPAEPRHR